MVKRTVVLFLVSCASVFAQQTPPQEPGIADNSFLIEEGYNQEFGVVQHIQSLSRMWDSGDYVYSFTQEWPFNPAPRHQLSYTVQGIGAESASDGFGIGDIALNYRYQLVQNDRAAFAPRLSLLLPTGDEAQGRGAGGAGVQFNLPLSLDHNEKLVTHWNLGGTIIPSAKDGFGSEAASYGYNAGQSFIFRTHNRFHLMLETVFNSSEAVVGPGQTQRENTIFISPGIRWAHNFSNGLQIVPGIGVPAGVGPSQGDVCVIFYLSIEHAFKRPKARVSSKQTLVPTIGN
jgi:hypothetical protein